MSDVIEVSFPPVAPPPDQPSAQPGYVTHRRFDRTARLLGDDGMARLAGAHVCVFGVGGVGSFAAEALSRSGVGRLTLTDFDDVCVTNSNRQLHAMKGTFGKNKAALMAERCRLINPDATVTAVEQFYNSDTSLELLPPDSPPSFVVDAIDNIKAKLHLLNTCVQRGIPVVSSMGAAGRLDPTQVRVAELCETAGDPFAKDVRKLLRLKYGVDTSRPCGIRVVYSVERRLDPVPLRYDHDAGFLCVCPGKANDFHTCDHRTRIDGSAAFVTGAFGLAVASVVVRALSGVTAR